MFQNRRATVVKKRNKMLPETVQRFWTLTVFGCTNLSISHASNDSCQLVSGGRIQDLGHCEDSVFPVAGLQLPGVVLHHGVGETLPLETVASETRFVADPLLIDVLIRSWHHAQDLAQKKHLAM